MATRPSGRTRRLKLECLEQKRLLAADQVLFFDNFDPIDSSNFVQISDGVVTGAESPTEFHDGNALYFNGRLQRLVTTKPISVSDATISFRLRLGDSSFPFENIDRGEEVVLEGTKDGGASWILINEFSATAPGYSSADVWDLAQFKVPSTLASPSTQFRLRQKSHSGNGFDNWAIDELSVFGQPFEIALQPVTPNVRKTAVSSVTVKFVEPINPASFTLADIKLTRDQVDVPLNSSVKINSLGGNAYRIDGLSPFTAAAGNYEFTVNGTGIDSASGVALTSIAATSWTVDLTAPQVVDVVDVSPDPRTGRFKAVNSIDVVFSEPIDLSTFDFNDLTLTRDGGANLIDSTVVVEALNATTARVSGLAALTGIGGQYVFTAGGTYTDLAGNIGKVSQADTWLANDPAHISLGGIVTFHEDSAPRAIASAAGVQDVDTPVMDKGSLTVDFFGAVAVGDRLGILNAPTSITQIGTRGNKVFYAGVQIGTFTGGDSLTPLVVKFNSAATLNAVQNLVRSVTYQHVGEIITQKSGFSVRMVINDGEGGTSQPAFKPVTLVPVNDAPVLKLNATSATYVGNAAPIKITPAATLTDVDNPAFYNGTLTVAVTAGRKNNEKLQLSGDFSISGTQLLYKTQAIGLVVRDGNAGVPLVLRFDRQATLPIVNDLLKSLSFSATAEKTFTARTLSFVFRDGKGGVDSSQSMVVKVTK